MQEPTLKDFLSICSPSILKQWKISVATGAQHNMAELGTKTSVSFDAARVIASTIAMLSMNWWIEQALEEKVGEDLLRTVVDGGVTSEQVDHAVETIMKPVPKKPKPPKVKQGQLTKEEHKARMAEVLQLNKANKKVKND